MTLGTMRNGETKWTNRNMIYRLIYESNKISKPEILRRLNLSMPTVMQHIEALKNDGLIYESGLLKSTGGRKAITFSCVPGVRYAIGIDITRNHVSGVLVDLKGNIVADVRVKEPFECAETYYQKLGSIVADLIDQANVTPDMILGVGIVVPGIITEENQVLEYTYVLPTRHLSCGEVSKFIPYPTMFYNDANAACIAEVWNDPNLNNCAYLSLSNSVGGAVLIHNELFLGMQNRAGEFGHMTIERDGKHCHCGKRGCLDVYCAATVLADEAGGDLEAFFKLLKQKDRKACASWADYVSYLATAVNIIRAAFDCDVIIGGYVGSLIDGHLEDLRNQAAQLNTFEYDGQYIRQCKLKHRAAAAGGAFLFIKPFIESV